MKTGIIKKCTNITSLILLLDVHGTDSRTNWWVFLLTSLEYESDSVETG